MFKEISIFLINGICIFFGSVLLLRAWLISIRFPVYHVLSQGIFHVTDWLILPLLRFIPNKGSIEGASLFSGWFAAFLNLFLLRLSSGISFTEIFPSIFIFSFLLVFKWAINLLVCATLLQSILSWTSPQSPAMSVLYQLTAPFLDPVRKKIPKTHGLDLSPLVLLVIAQILFIIIKHLSIV